MRLKWRARYYLGLNRMGRKINASIYVDAEIIQKARELGLNISKTCENALKEAIRRLEGSNPHTNCGNPQFGSSKHIVDGTGFEPAASAMPTLAKNQNDRKNHRRFQRLL